MVQLILMIIVFGGIVGILSVFGKKDPKEKAEDKWNRKLTEFEIETDTKNIDKIIIFLEEQIEIMKDEEDELGRTKLSTAAFGTARLLGKSAPGLTGAVHAIKSITDMTKWKGQGGVTRLRPHMDSLKKYKDAIEGGITLSFNKSEKFYSGILALKGISKFINFRQEELEALIKEEVINEDDVKDIREELYEIAELVTTEQRHVKSFHELFKDLKSIKADLKAKIDKAKNAYDKGYLTEEQYHKKIKEIEESLEDKIKQP